MRWGSPSETHSSTTSPSASTTCMVAPARGSPVAASTFPASTLVGSSTISTFVTGTPSATSNSTSEATR
ncbi:Uncharacterised protein [Collinsella aerofaciens]|uniref:Uncharacterized protein n=1 Tax=Collinsella aerofaciens TaxID=74426 RepID=A0A5K1J3U4_9ACTN|nr:Uncharacterised protein [Collinsella aerofaciens]